MDREREYVVREGGEQVRTVETRTSYPGLDIEREAPASAWAAAPWWYRLTEDRVRWGPIWAGVFAAITSLLILAVLGLAIGLTTFQVPAVGADAAEQAGAFSAIWGALTAIIAFIIGGYVAGRSSAVFGQGWGAFNGAMVFVLALPLILLLTGSAATGLLGLIQNAFNLGGVTIGDIAPGVTPGQAAATAQAGAWWTLIGLLLGLGAATVGGWLGGAQKRNARTSE